MPEWWLGMQHSFKNVSSFNWSTIRTQGIKLPNEWPTVLSTVYPVPIRILGAAVYTYRRGQSKSIFFLAFLKIYKIQSFCRLYIFTDLPNIIFHAIFFAFWKKLRDVEYVYDELSRLGKISQFHWLLPLLQVNWLLIVRTIPDSSPWKYL